MLESWAKSRSLKELSRLGNICGWSRQMPKDTWLVMLSVHSPPCCLTCWVPPGIQLYIQSPQSLYTQFKILVIGQLFVHLQIYSKTGQMKYLCSIKFDWRELSTVANNTYCKRITPFNLLCRVKNLLTSCHIVLTKLQQQIIATIYCNIQNPVLIWKHCIDLGWTQALPLLSNDSK